MSKTQITAHIIDQTVQLANLPLLASGSEGALEIRCDFCSLWDGYAKTAVFYRNVGEVYHILLVDDVATVPSEVLADSGYFFFGVMGVADNTRTTEVVRLNVAQGAITTATTKPEDPTPDIYSQLLAAYGTMEAALAAEAAARKAEIAVERARITNLAKLQEGSTTGDAELADLRVGYDGTTYENAGEAVRFQIGAIEADRESVSKNLFNKDTVTLHGWVSTTTGVFEYYPDNPYVNYYAHSDFIPVKAGSKYTWSGGKAYGYAHFINGCVWYTAEKSFVSSFADPKDDTRFQPRTLTAPETAAFIVLNFTNYTATDLGTVMFEQGEEASPYEPFSYTYYQNNLIVRESQIEKSESDKLELLLPSRYDLVVGDTFELFYKGVMLCKDPYQYNILVTCDIGNAYYRKFSVTPTVAGSHTLTIQVSDDYGNVIAEKSTELAVSAKMTSPTENINVLCVGDSLTQGGQWVDEAYRRLTKTSNTTQHNATAPVGDGLSNIAFVGKKTTTNGAGYEGTGGWRYEHYIDTTNTENPFLYNGAVDFTSYCTELGIDMIDQCYILLGWNMANYSEDTFKTDAKAFIDLLVAHNPAIKIVLMGLQIPAYDGLGNNYGASGKYANFRALQEYVFNVDKWNLDIATDYPANVSCVNISGQFDTEYNMPARETTPNARSATTVTEQSNGVHPAPAGYMQIADAAYRKFTADNA